MTRREVFKRFTGGLAAAGVTAAVDVGAVEAPCDPARVLVVFKTEGLLSREQKQHLVECWKRAGHGTAWERVRGIVLDDGMSLEVHDLARFGVRPPIKP